MERSMGRLVSILYRKNQVYLNTVLKPLDLTASELPILIYLCHHDGVSQEELSAFMSIDKASTARVVQSLLKKGFLRKDRNPSDRRANKVFLTELAVQSEAKIKILLQQWNSFLTDGMDEQSVNTMFAVLENMVEKVETAKFKEMWEKN